MESRQHTVHANGVGCYLEGKALRQMDDACLRDTVCAEPWRCRCPSNGRDVDNAPTETGSPHVSDLCLTTVSGGHEIIGEHSLEVSDWDVLQLYPGCPESAADVVHCDIDPTECTDGSFDQRVCSRHTGDVALDEKRLAPQRLNHAHCLHACLFVDVGDNDVAPSTRKLDTVGTAHRRPASARYDRDAVNET
jgi:hypothetical protein